jgi:hypothetical protein
MSAVRGWFLSILLSAACCALAAPVQVDFDREIRPIFAQHCYECHGPDKAKGGLRLTDAKIAMGELKSGAKAIVPGDVKQSELLRRVKSNDADEMMPPKGERLTAAQIEKLQTWIEQGAKWGVHWAYRPIVRPDVPAHAAIDELVLRELRARKIAPSPPADPYTLIKRVYYDLLGLPPSVAEADAFAADPSDAAYEKLVDRLLASPHFGERWGRHWLDKARYADSDGYEKDGPRPDAWKYRDWVIDAINRDLPFDQFTIQQLAGDLLPGASEDEKLATAFHRQTLTNKEGGVDAEQFRVEAVFDRVETTGAVWLGLTVGCARCHTHKYDAITQREYYQLLAFFNNADEVEIKVPTSSAAMAKYEKEMKVWRPKMEAIDKKISDLRSEISKQMPAWAVELHTIIEDLGNRNVCKLNDGGAIDAWAAGDARMLELNKERTGLVYDAPKPAVMLVRVLGERQKNLRQTPLMIRGDFLRPDESVSPGVLSVLHPLKTPSPTRLDLAKWLMDDANPLTARVAANDIWLHLFGAGLVRTPNDFGVRGDKPTHPELLDYLASEYRRLGWSRKAMIKQIVMSAAYRQSSRGRPDLTEIDAENRSLARQNRWRVEGEIVSDVTLSAAGLLSNKIGGPSVFPPMPADVAALSYANNFIWKTSTGDDRYRRGMYTFFKRTAPHPNLMTFDCPDSTATAISRGNSDTPLQALVTLNNEVFAESAQAMARRILQNNAESDLGRMQAAFRSCVIRPADSQELAVLIRLLESARAWYKEHPADAKLAAGKNEQAAWMNVCRVILNLDEFLNRE